MNVDQRDLFNFYTAVTHRSFSAAAQALGVSKGYISKSIKRLENQVSNKLIHRSARQWQLTAAGSELFATAQSMQTSLDHGLEQLQIISSTPSGCIKISAPPAVADSLLAPLLSSFMHQHPNIRIDMHLDTALVDIVSGGFDLVFRGARLEDSNLIARKLFDIEHVLVASPAFLKQHGTPKTPKDLEQLPCMGYPVDGRIIWPLRQARKSVRISIEPTLSSNQSSLLKQCALQGAGITKLLSFMVTEELRAKTLIPILKDWQLDTLPLYAVYPSREFLPLKTKTLLSHITSTLKQTH